MKILLSGGFEFMDQQNGWGPASHGMYYALKRAGLDVEVPCLMGQLGEKYKADIEISFHKPVDHNFRCEDSYKIGLTPWESTKFYEGWEESFLQLDEVWGTSNWTTDLYKKLNVNDNLFTYRHGISDKYEKKRNIFDKNKPFTFLHVGEPSERKNGQMVVDAFIELFGDNPKFRLIMKCFNNSSIIVGDPEMPVLSGPPYMFYENIKYITDPLCLEQMMILYKIANVFVYPSFGEGFGYSPLEAICLGTPTICTSAWADYSDYITAPLNSTLGESPNQGLHPGKVYNPDKEHLKELMLKSVHEHELWSEIAFKNADLAYEEFNWDTTTKPVVEKLKNL